MWLVAFVAGLVACGSNPKNQPGASSVLAVAHVTVIDMAGTPPQVDQTVLVRDGRIERIAPADEIEIDSGVPVIDGRGGWLIPGRAALA